MASYGTAVEVKIQSFLRRKIIEHPELGELSVFQLAIGRVHKDWCSSRFSKKLIA